MLSDGFVFKLEVFQIGDVHVLNEGHGVGGVVFLLDAGEEFLGVGADLSASARFDKNFHSLPVASIKLEG